MIETATTELRPRFASRLGAEIAGLDCERRQVRFLLGSDIDIAHETRVAFAPRHLTALAEVLGSAGLELETFVFEGAGDRAGFDDREYAATGARIVPRPGLADLEVDVIHALKEPTAWESRVQGSFLRIGALHLASFPPGVCELLKLRSASAIIDGGTVGSCSYLLDDGDRTPIVASMSRFAGRVAGRSVVEGLEKNGVGPGTIVVVGGGVAGQSAIGEVLPKLERLVVIEPFAAAQERLEAFLAQSGVTNFEILPALGESTLDGAVGVVFAHRSGARAAEKVCHLDQIRRMRLGAAVADIAIDQGGSIAHDGYREDDDAHTARRKYAALLEGFHYYAETNMPREVPHEASQMHGDSSWVYVAMLLALVARHGSPAAAVEALLERPVTHYDDPSQLDGSTLFECLVRDLRNGLQLAFSGGELVIADADIERHPPLADWVRACAVP